MENRYTQGMLQDYNIEPVTTSIMVAKGLAVLSKIKAVAAVADKAKALAGKLGIGGVTQDRFIARYTEIRDWFVKAGYLTLGSKFHEDALTKYKIRKTQVTDKKTKGNYEPEFARLHEWCVAVLNNSNPGLGNLWKKYFPSFTMANLGNITSEGALEGLKILIDNFPPGTFDPSITTMPAPSTAIVNDTIPVQPVTPISNTGAKTVNDLPTNATVTQATALGPDLSNKNLMIMAGLVVGVIILFFVFKK